MPRRFNVESEMLPPPFAELIITTRQGFRVLEAGVMQDYVDLARGISLMSFNLPSELFNPWTPLVIQFWRMC